MTTTGTTRTRLFGNPSSGCGRGPWEGLQKAAALAQRGQGRSSFQTSIRLLWQKGAVVGKGSVLGIARGGSVISGGASADGRLTTF
jgi:hypothetical protein